MARRIVGIDWGIDDSYSCAVYTHLDDAGVMHIDHEVELDPATMRPDRQLGATADGALVESGWANGHKYSDNGDLLDVKCSRHDGFGFPQAPITDATVQM